MARALLPRRPISATRLASSSSKGLALGLDALGFDALGLAVGLVALAVLARGRAWLEARSGAVPRESVSASATRERSQRRERSRGEREREGRGRCKGSLRARRRFGV